MVKLPQAEFGPMGLTARKFLESRRVGRERWGAAASFIA